MAARSNEMGSLLISRLEQLGMNEVSRLINLQLRSLLAQNNVSEAGDTGEESVLARMKAGQDVADDRGTHLKNTIMNGTFHEAFATLRQQGETRETNCSQKYTDTSTN